jgi:rhodanese-related sulfurtransferase
MRVDLLAVEPESEVIVYCRAQRVHGGEAREDALQHGFKRVRPLLGGIDAWIAAGHEVEPAGEPGVIPLSVQRSPT